MWVSIPPGLESGWIWVLSFPCKYSRQQDAAGKCGVTTALLKEYSHGQLPSRTRKNAYLCRREQKETKAPHLQS